MKVVVLMTCENTRVTFVYKNLTHICSGLIMKLESRTTIHAGVNFVIAPMAALERINCLEFQKQLSEVEIHITQTNYGERELILQRDHPDPLEIKIALIGPQIGQILIVIPQLGSRSLGVASREAQDVVKAFQAAWPDQRRQIIACDATIRDLYETTAQHSFQELWENRLKQPQEGLHALGRPVLGGGLRFVIPATENEPTIDAKIESFLLDTSKLFLEAQFKWPFPQEPGVVMDPENRLNHVDDYIQKEMVNFIREGQM